MGGYAQAYTLYSSVRPFGITAIIGGVDENGPQLYMIEPSGSYWVCAGLWWWCLPGGSYIQR